MTDDEAPWTGDEFDDSDIGLDWTDESASPAADPAAIPPSGLRCATCGHSRLTCAECGGLNGFPLTAKPPCSGCRERIAADSLLWTSEFLVGAAPNGEVLDLVVT